MKCNVGKADRIIRAILGVVIGTAGIFFGSWFGLLGLVLLGTAAMGWCPLYLPARLTTCKSE